jgi:hypothetical protein
MRLRMSFSLYLLLNLDTFELCSEIMENKDESLEDLDCERLSFTDLKTLDVDFKPMMLLTHHLL